MRPRRPRMTLGEALVAVAILALAFVLLRLAAAGLGWTRRAAPPPRPPARLLWAPLRAGPTAHRPRSNRPMGVPSGSSSRISR